MRRTRFFDFPEFPVLARRRPAGSARLPAWLALAFALCACLPACAKTESDLPSARALRGYHSDWDDIATDLRKHKSARAVRHLRALDDGDSLAQLYQSILLAQSRLAAGDTLDADETLAGALAIVRDPVWVRHLHGLRLRTFSALSPAARKDYLTASLRAPLDGEARAEVLYRMLDIDTTVLSRAERYDALRKLVPLALPGPRLDSAYRAWLAAFPPGDTVKSEQLLALDAEEKLGLWNAAITRASALQRAAENAEAARGLQARLAMAHYNKGAYGEALREYARYRERYGDTPEVLLQIARAHRALSEDAKSQEWYSRLVERFPVDGRAAEVLWMRAFEDEMLGRTDVALAAYTRIARVFPQHARSGEALFRRGWVLYKRGDFAAAQRAFAVLREAGKAGRLIGAARYWEAKAFSRAGDSLAARAGWASLVREHPFGYYGHTARAELAREGALPDSLRWEQLLSADGEDSVRSWLATVSRPGVASAENLGESVWLPVAKLFDLGLDTLAVLTLQARVNAAPSDLWLLYDAAVRCRAAGFDYEAYRFGRRLSDRVPVEVWPDAPTAVLRLFYPPSYARMVQAEAQRAGLPPALVLALIKQESGFDPRAVSRVGARGLMQLMPVTATEQARREGVSGFHPDSLFDPAVNIQLGVAYLRDVLKRQEGNIGYALAHYNAGPTALARWRSRLDGRPLEDMAEDIGYAETREYVKRVSANYMTYQVLWE